MHVADLGARAGLLVVVLDGADFDAGAHLSLPRATVAVYLRARDPRCEWNSALFAKLGSCNQIHFNVFSADLPATAGPDIGFDI